MSRLVRVEVTDAQKPLTGLVVPNSTVAATDAALVRFEHSRGVDLDPDLVWILAVGSDARPGENMLRVRGDALQLVGMNTETGAATTIGIPRDSWVEIPGHGTQKVNAALSLGGVPLMVQTVEGIIDQRIDHVAVIDFEGFKGLTTALGGVTLQNDIAFEQNGH